METDMKHSGGKRFSRRTLLKTSAFGAAAAIGKLQAAGLNMDQIKMLGTTTLDYAKEKAGPDLVRQVAGSIPGLSGYV